MAQGKTKALTMPFRVLATIFQIRYHEPAPNVALEMLKSSFVLLLISGILQTKLDPNGKIIFTLKNTVYIPT